MPEMREIDLRALELLVDTCPESLMKRERMKKLLRKKWRQGLLSREKEDAQQKWRMCEARFSLGDFSDFDGWELRDAWAATMWHTRPYQKPMWKGESGRVFVIGEQGMGDEIFFSAYIRPGMVFETDERLIPAFTRAGIECVPVRFSPDRGFRYKPEIPEDCEYWVPVADLMRYCQPVFRHLVADPEQVRRFERYRGRVGINWRGRTGEYPLEAFQRVAERPLALQYDLNYDEDVEVPEGLDLRDDVEGLLGLLANLDRVVTVSSSVAHLAVNSGVRTEVILTPLKANLCKFPWKYALYGMEPYKSLEAYLRRAG